MRRPSFLSSECASPGQTVVLRFRQKPALGNGQLASSGIRREAPRLAEMNRFLNAAISR